MSWRTVIISNQAKLDYKMGLMVVRGLETQKILVDEIAVLVIENPAVSFTGCLVETLVEKKVKVIFCDGKRNLIVLRLVPFLHLLSRQQTGYLQMLDRRFGI